MKDINYNNLRSVYLHDICDNISILKTILPCFPKLKSKEERLVQYKESPVLQAFDLIDYADITNNRKLRDAVTKEWYSELTYFFNE